MIHARTLGRPACFASLGIVHLIFLWTWMITILTPTVVNSCSSARGSLQGPVGGEAATPVGLRTGQQAGLRGVFRHQNRPSGLAACRWPLRRQESKGKEQKRPKRKLCNPSCSFFCCSGQKSRSYPRDVKKSGSSLARVWSDWRREGPPNSRESSCELLLFFLFSLTPRSC